jgi:hypothetical protein
MHANFGIKSKGKLAKKLIFVRFLGLPFGHKGVESAHIKAPLVEGRVEYARALRPRRCMDGARRLRAGGDAVQ